MLKIKRIYTFVLETFVPVFAMTFGICLFIVLMQFLWKYVEDLVGKGLDNLVLAELFFYAALSLIPLALPLSILLASLMAFGNMGERLELLAIKASGVSLLKTMKPLIIMMIFISVGAFFFQNEAMPRINVKFRSLLYSIKQKSPELDIPEGSFYSGIENRSIYVKKKDPETGMLRNVMIYDTSQGFDNMSVFVCDSARMQISETKDFLLLTLYNGQQFANFTQSVTGSGSTSIRRNSFVPYRRESFKSKEIIIAFDANFNRMDESAFESSQLAKNISELNRGIDSMNILIDSLNLKDRTSIKNIYFAYRDVNRRRGGDEVKNTIQIQKSITPLNFDSLINNMDKQSAANIYNMAVSSSENQIGTTLFSNMEKADLQKMMRAHRVEWHRKFTLSFACIIFFFIGAPLGAIIRKGGLGMPVVISVILFIVYYIFDNIGVKMARDGVWEAWQGMWLSSFVLFPLGVFLTYKAMNDSALFNTEAYGKFIRKILWLQPKEDSIEEQYVDEKDIPDLSTMNVDPELVNSLQTMSEDKLKDMAKNYQRYGYDGDTLYVILSILKEKGVSLFDIRIKNLDYDDAIRNYTNFIKSYKWAMMAFGLIFVFLLLSMFGSVSGIFLYLSVIAYLGLFIRTFISYSDMYGSIDRKTKSKNKWRMLFSLWSMWGFYWYFRREAKKDIENIRW